MSEVPKWRVTISRWDVFLVRQVEAETAEGAQEIALEWAADDFNLEHLDGGLNSVEAELEEDEG